MTIAVAHFPLLLMATHLISQYMLEEKGPAGIFHRIRLAAGVNIPYLAEPVMVNEVAVYDYASAIAAGVPDEYMEIAYASNGSFTGDVLSCYRCFAPYAAAIALLTAVFPPLFYILAAAGGNILITRWFNEFGARNDGGDVG